MGLLAWSLILGLLLGPAGPGFAAALSETPYSVSIEGAGPDKLPVDLAAVSDLLSLKDHAPASLSLLRKRAERDLERFTKMLKAEGYYRPGLELEMDAEVDPVHVVFRVDPGPPYLLKTLDVRITGAQDLKEEGLREGKDIGLSLGDPLKARSVLEAQKTLLRRLNREGFPFAGVAERRVIVDHADQSASVSFTIDPGRRARFGRTAITGLRSVKESFVRARIPWKEGDPYNADLLAALQKKLIVTSLFATARVTPGERLDEKGGLPITVALAERKHRSIGGGVSYKTDEGPGAALTWEHRNLLGEAERLRLGFTASTITQAAEGAFRKPYFLRPDQSLRLALRLSREEPDAYLSRSLTSSLLVDRQLRGGLSVGAGVGFKTSRVEQLGTEDRYELLGLPLQLDWDGSDNLLDPSRGGRLALRLTPSYGNSGEDLMFARSYGRYSHYLQLAERPSLLLAGRLGLGIIGGEERDSLPADERFYAGGGGSIRGYAYQSVGPLSGETPIGGKSVVEMSLELRTRLTDSLGLVAFLDGGSAFSGNFSGSDERILWGAGAGVRYFTPVGPLRLDIGFPLDRREGVDDAFQVYISLGQAF